MTQDKPKALRLSQADKDDVALIKAHYQLDNDSSAIRIAIRKIAKHIRSQKALRP